ncbi:sensor histidine kinase [Actinacidiphila bryophytorum]|uniref:Anti-sigma regulatory factor, serine/threonine protein kinase n=1 Tax=Actinacidiphila bryophytorum TaxID=1436133 RepID=A0A9W4MF89_9ACTN|nr:sensor histidine kinase [Actinacidiphila bryophytorum]MBM9436825.1 sensor histidine kinase [Actinacidiphila bryophytorum]MBN6542332.1 sensor histidine kinase [Actinacidiphila bryophytorum]CAG7654466.1 Anti-sigma regulatory factor, serine/threonine protein kinase [Actinacidiphila bryophytorum]
MTSPLPSPGTTGNGYRHELYPYRGRDEFVEGTMSFIQDALEIGEAVVVAVPPDKASMLRTEIREDDAVRYVDTSSVAHYPGRHIAAWQEWISEHVAHGRPVRGIGESPWDTVRTPAEADELRYHEWLLNKVFAQGPAWWLLCPYDLDHDDAELEEMARCHPEVRSQGRTVPCEEYDSQAPYACSELSLPLERFEEFAYTSGDLGAMRDKIVACAELSGLTGRRLSELCLAATEVATNSIRHGGGRGILRAWNQHTWLVCDFHDAGHFTDPLAGRTRPSPRQLGGRGLWLVHQLCDLVQIRSTPDKGTMVRLHTELPAVV